MRKIYLFIAALCCAVTINATEGALSGKFSVSATKKVHFSKGNLRATAEKDGGVAKIWSFADNQWDCVGSKAANTTISGNGKVSANGFVDLFGWSGETYYGIHNSTNNADYSGDFEDWGQNEIINGGNQSYLWRTMTQDEWEYLFQTREDASSKYGAAKVMGKPGIVLLPDERTLPSDCGFTPGMLSSNNWNSVPSTNKYDNSTWPAMEAAGAVFLPASGFRESTSVNLYDQVGFYWSSTPYGPFAYQFGFTPTTVNAEQGSIVPCYYGCSVRLVIDVDSAEGIEEVPPSLRGRSGEASKILRDGQLFILRGDKLFNAIGTQVK